MLDELALIILNYNSYVDTIKCVSKLASFSLDYKIIIVDNCSTDDSIKNITNSNLLNDNIILVLNNVNGGYSSGNNIGIKYAKENFNSKVIGIINPDVIIPNSEVLVNMFNQLNLKHNYAMIGGNSILCNNYSLNNSAWDIPSNFSVVMDKFYLWNKLPFKNLENNKFNIKVLNDELGIVDCIVGCFFMIKTDIFYRIGLFDENVFLYDEENILGIKLKKMGYRTLVSLKSFYFHEHDFSKERQSNFHKRIRVIINHYNSRKYLIKTYYPKYLLLPLFIVKYINILHIGFASLKKLIK